MFRKLKKTLLIVIISLIVLVVLVVWIVDRDEETGKISISFLDRETKISESDFTRLIEEELDLTELSQIDWTEVYNKGLEKKYQTDNISIPKYLDQENGSLQKENDENNLAKQVFIEYLQESEAGFDMTQNPFQLAVEYRDQDQQGKIDEIITSLDKKIIRIESITPSEEIIGYHLAKLRLLREMREIVKTIKLSEKGMQLNEIITESQFEHLANLSLILKKYLTYFFLV